ncbi:MAG: SRPBCC domain-containing protein [Gammaproteobacteria bacterium]|nr:SRPBCC domain-containing protein [Gammaproteobacteria bacterium]
MREIVHRVGIKASPAEVYNQLTTDAGLAKWWTSFTTGAGPVGSVIEFDFRSVQVPFQVIELIENELVRWRHVGDSDDVWFNTEVSFTIEPEHAQTFVLFRHGGWPDKLHFMAHCSTKWGVFMLSLKESLEHGIGRPFPDDLHIDHN